MIEGHVGTADFASRDNRSNSARDSTTSCTALLANCWQNSTSLIAVKIGLGGLGGYFGMK